MSSQLTPSAIRAYVRHKMQVLGEMPCSHRKYAAAGFVIREVLGQAWIEQRVMSPKRDPFLQRPQDAPFGDYAHPDRVVQLAELLLNMQEVDGFDRLVRELHTRDLEFVVTELQGAAFLLQNGIPFRFVTPQGRRGADYDVEFVFDGETVACEMKGRIEGTAPSVSGIANKLKSVAKRQLPRDRPSVLFVRIPHSWVTTRRFGAMVDAGLRRVFNDYHRLNSVVFHWEEWRPLQPLGAIRITRFRPYHNPMPRLPLPTFETALKAWPHDGGSWLSMERIACENGDVVRVEGLSAALQISEQLNKGSVPALGVAVAYNGSLEHLRTLPADSILTVVDSKCDHFELFDDAQDAKSANITLNGGTVTSFHVARGPDTNTWQLQIPTLMHDESLEWNGHGIVIPAERVQSTTRALNGGQIGVNDIFDSDGFVQQLKQIFAQLRSEGDLRRDAHRLSNVRVTS